MKRILICLIAFFLIGSSATAQRQTKGNAEDLEAIKKIAVKWQDGWNRHDMKALAALMTEDVDFVTVSGGWQKSPGEFAEYYTKRHVMQYRESVWTLKSTRVKFVKSDIALAHLEWSLKGDKDPDGTPRPPRDGIFTWVLAKKKGKWLIIASQNTNIREPAPVK